MNENTRELEEQFEQAKKNNVLSLNEVAFDYVEHIPPREFHYKIGAKTEELVAVLSGTKPGGTLTFSVSGLLPKHEREKKLRQIRDRLKIAVKHAPGFWEIHRRSHCYYARRYPEEDYYKDESSYTVGNNEY